MAGLLAHALLTPYSRPTRHFCIIIYHSGVLLLCSFQPLGMLHGFIIRYRGSIITV